MSDSLAITPRNLGAICLPGYCPKCFKLLLNMKFNAPFNHFGAAIFGDAQKCQEAILGHYLAKNGCLPKQFAPFCDCVARTECSKDWRKFRYTHPTGIIFYGSPDEVLDRKDGTLCVIDHKTAHAKGTEDKFHNQYEIQVIGYSNIAEGMGLGTVSLAGLLYWDAQVADVVEKPEDHFENGKLWMSFKPKGLEIEVDYTKLDAPMKELQKIWKAKRLPEGREGCEDCKKMELLLGFDEQFRANDQLLLSRYCFDWNLRDGIRRDLYQHQQLRLEAFMELEQSGDLAFSNDGVVANWEFAPIADAERLAA
jgi:hypothetical protein